MRFFEILFQIGYLFLLFGSLCHNSYSVHKPGCQRIGRSHTGAMILKSLFLTYPPATRVISCGHLIAALSALLHKKLRLTKLHFLRNCACAPKTKLSSLRYMDIFSKQNNPTNTKSPPSCAMCCWNTARQTWQISKMYYRTQPDSAKFSSKTTKIKTNADYECVCMQAAS